MRTFSLLPLAALLLFLVVCPNGVVNAEIGYEESVAPSAMQPDSAEYHRAATVYFDRCAGCHGVERQGAAGIELFASSMQRVGDEAIKHVLHFGTLYGMPNWGTTEQLSDSDVELLTQFLQLPAPKAPAFSASQVDASWRTHKVSGRQSESRTPGIRVSNLFVSLLHDVGRVLLIDGESKEVLFSVETDMAPTAIELSQNNRYLYVLHRDGRVVSIDLQLPVPQVVASVRIGFEARSIAAGGNKRQSWLIAGSQAPPQIVQLDPISLRPLRTTEVAQNQSLPEDVNARVTQVLNLGNSRRIALATTGLPGDIYALRHPQLIRDELIGDPVHTGAQLRQGSLDLSGRYAILPTRASKVAVFDSREQRLLPMLNIPGLKAGNVGTSFVDPDFGPVWASSSVFSSTVPLLGTDPERHKEHAWRVVRTLKTAEAGSLFVASHPRSKHIWVDSAVSRSPEAAASVTVFNRVQPDVPSQVIPLHELIDLAGYPGRVLHPQFNAAGDELWLTVWNRIDRRSAIVVIDDKSLTVKALIEDPRLITPIRTFSVASLLAEKRRG